MSDTGNMPTVAATDLCVTRRYVDSDTIHSHAAEVATRVHTLPLSRSPRSCCAQSFSWSAEQTARMQTPGPRIDELDYQTQSGITNLMSRALKRIKDFVQTQDPEMGAQASATDISPKDNSTCPVIPDDFRCPISLDLMKDPVIVATGQVLLCPNILLIFFLFPFKYADHLHFSSL